jgi:uncharacterized protein YcbX
MTAIVRQITVYPIKSLDGIHLRQARMSVGGALLHDREFAFYNAEGRTVNAKKYPKIQQIRTFYDLEARTVRLETVGSSDTFSLDNEQAALAEWMSAFLQTPVQLKQKQAGGFPDDDTASGFTISSLQTLETVRKWFPELDLDNLRRRFRFNIEADAPAPFWEDGLLSAQSEQWCKVGEVDFWATGACARCPVPARDPFSGEPDSGFQQTFTRQRADTLPDFVEKSFFNHCYRLSINTKSNDEQVGKIIRVGDVITAVY